MAATSPPNKRWRVVVGLAGTGSVLIWALILSSSVATSLRVPVSTDLITAWMLVVNWTGGSGSAQIVVSRSRLLRITPAKSWLGKQPCGALVMTALPGGAAVFGQKIA